MSSSGSSAQDMGFSDIGCYGGEIDTPHIEGMADAGVRFGQFNNASKCEPSRAALLSGYYHQVCGMGIKCGITMGQATQAAGYHTMTVGKWHVDGAPEDRGFHHAFGHLSGASDFFSGNQTFHLDGKPFDYPPGVYLTDLNTDDAVRFIEEARDAHPELPFLRSAIFTFSSSITRRLYQRDGSWSPHTAGRGSSMI